MIEAKIIGAQHVVRWLRLEEKRHIRAMENAIKVEGFRLRKTLIREIKQGAPGGKRFKPLSSLARRKGKRWLRDRPFANPSIVKEVGGWGSGRFRKWSMADTIRYHIPGGRNFEMHIGWTGPFVSSSWKRIAKKQQEGFSFAVPIGIGRWFAYKGGKLSKRSRRRMHFFLRKETKQFKVPARPIIEPFWAAHIMESKRNIRFNFRRKLRGLRI